MERIDDSLTHHRPTSAILLLLDQQQSAAVHLGEALHFATNSDVFTPQSIEEARHLLNQRSFMALVLDTKVGSSWTTNLIEEFGPTLKQAGTRIVMLSSDEAHRQSAQLSGADLFLLKPIADSTLTTLVKGMMRTPHLYNAN